MLQPYHTGSGTSSKGQGIGGVLNRVAYAKKIGDVSIFRRCNPGRLSVPQILKTRPEFSPPVSPRLILLLTSCKIGDVSIFSTGASGSTTLI